MENSEQNYEEQVKDKRMVTIRCVDCKCVIGEIEEESYWKAVCPACYRGNAPTF